MREPIPGSTAGKPWKPMGTQQGHYNSVLDLDQWLFELLTLTMRYVDLRDKLQAEECIYGKIVFSNAQSATPFIGIESYLKTVRSCGIPVIQDSVTMYPAGTDQDTFVRLTDGRQGDALTRSTGIVARLAEQGLKSLGVVFDYESFGDFAPFDPGVFR